MNTHENMMYNSLKDLSTIPGPVGREYLVRQWLVDRWKKKSIEVFEDRIGNLLFKIGGKGPKLLIQAHMDEIGFVIRYITPEGFLLLDPAQESHRTSPGHLYMVGQEAQILVKNKVVATGVFAAPSGHVLTTDLINKPLTFNSFYVDIGVNSKEEAESLGVQVGANVVWHRDLKRVGSRYVGKAMDDRVGLHVMDLLLNEIDVKKLNYELWFGATVSEENGAYGAHSLGKDMKFDLAIPLDVGLVGDIPTISNEEYPTKLGAGPSLVYKDGFINYDENLLDSLEKIALENKLPFQRATYHHYGSDGLEFYKNGIPSALIGIPTRYTHTAFEMVDPKDIVVTVQLLKSFIEHYNKRYNL
ncbi:MULTISPECIES: M42 family metallopeptidase [Bacillus cereus group]|uniref:M42 family metallopeptidase n=1 Tax=Bacillus cereus group TaxID=86661 RepID=UPI000CD9EE37|nr:MULTISPECIES: M42 family peptidase [Bacillus cereus group]MEC3193931.1 M42 family peptidase [Bacillus cereus]QFQ28777.1 M42 family peptidase [Bacillus thuringiensis]WIG15410.1 M42 family peptidase [Bacillus thuringiensis]WJX08079.1 M42 family peptidase [Bacillus cereus]